MPSTLRTPVTAYHPGPLSPTRPVKKQKMSITQTYYLAHTARGKLSAEAARGDHDLRLLVGHANLLDSLMLELADAEREQEAWFNETVKRSTTTAETPRRVQWVDSISEEEDASDEASNSDDDSDAGDYSEDEDFEMITSSKQTSQYAIINEYSVDEEDDDAEEDEEEDAADLQLIRTTSHSSSPHSPPELVSDDSSDDDMEDVSPRSPPSEHLNIHGIKSRDFAATNASNQSSQDSRKHTRISTTVVGADQLHQSSPMVAAY